MMFCTLKAVSRELAKDISSGIVFTIRAILSIVVILFRILFGFEKTENYSERFRAWGFRIGVIIWVTSSWVVVNTPMTSSKGIIITEGVGIIHGLIMVGFAIVSAFVSYGIMCGLEEAVKYCIQAKKKHCKIAEREK